MVVIRTMRKGDLDTVRRIEASAFGQWWAQFRDCVSPYFRRTRTNVLVCLEKDPQGCFVAEQEDYVVGFVFSRTWGTVGWLGTFGVLPEQQGKDIGKHLVSAGLEYLGQKHDRVIGLETRPENSYNLGLYMKLHFQAGFPTFSMSKMLRPSSKPALEVLPWSTAGIELRQTWLADLRRVADNIHPELDYSKEITSTNHHDLGDTLVLTDGNAAVGHSTVWVVPFRGGPDDKSGVIQVLTLDPLHTNVETFDTILKASETFAHAHGKKRLFLPINAKYAWAIGHLLRAGYRVDRMMIRMTLKGMDENMPRGPCVNCSAWAA